ncbi:MAG: N-acetyl sugar amidotransferase [Candidatus Latescibacteria bacterium]|nr:N-acetyl sugar amidotransferase [Candidatus Latescibacterota bacterium]
MKYCKKCLMPDTRPGIRFVDGVCVACIHYEKQHTTNWEKRRQELEKLCEKYRGKYGNGYDCAIAVSGGKDSHFQVYYVKEVMKMNPVLLAVGNIDWTETGRKNLANLSDTFNCDIISMIPNHHVTRILAKKALVEIGGPTWYADALIYAYPYRMTMKLGLKLLFYGEDVNYTYGGKYDEETPSALLQFKNDVVKPLWDKWLMDGDLTEKDLESTRQPTLEECRKAGLEPVYMSYFVPWDSYHNYEVAKRWGFRQLIHEYVREGTIEQYNQVDSIGYLINNWLKYPKFAHASATEMACRWIRAGMKTRDEMIPMVKQCDKHLDQGIVDAFLAFTGMRPHNFWSIVDKWYNPQFFRQDRDGVWHEKFEVGIGMKE